MALFSGVGDHHLHRRSSIPHLFPDKLVDICVQKVLKLLLKSGEILEEHNEQQHSLDLNDLHLPQEYFYSEKLRRFTDIGFSRKHSKKRIESFKGERKYLTHFLVSDVMDVLAEASRNVKSSKGFHFLFMLLCNERTHRFVIHSINEEENMHEFWINDMGAALAAKGLKKLVNIQNLVLQKVCTDSMMFIISENCHKLVYLDISYSERVTGIGLLGLCGLSKTSGCKYLRDLILKHGDNCEPIVPKVIACLLRYLEHLEVLDLRNLHEGIEYYYRGRGHGHYHPKPERIRPLNLMYYTGSEKLLDVIDICPKLRTLELIASDSLPTIGEMLAQRGTALDHLTLIWEADANHLMGLKSFLEACGSRISNLEIICPKAKFQSEDFITIGLNCRLLENLSISHFKIESNDENDFSHHDHEQALFPFLTSLKVTHIDHEPEITKDIFKGLLIHSPELERLHLYFDSYAYFFSDFFLEDILYLNPLGALREFILSNCSLTLISALKLISSRPKLHYMGNVLYWDVETSELDTFAQILRKAKGMNLLQDISIV